MKQLRKWLSCFLAVVMVVFMTGLTAFANEETSEIPALTATGQSCIETADCPADTHNPGCPLYEEPAPEEQACTGTEDCPADTHNPGCPLYEEPAPEEQACTGTEDCPADTHNPGCPLYEEIGAPGPDAGNLLPEIPDAAALIQALPSLEDLQADAPGADASEEEREAYEASLNGIQADIAVAREAYEALTQEEKASFDPGLLAKLEALEALCANAAVPTAVESDDVCSIGDEGYPTLAAAFASAEENDEIVLLAGISLDEPIVVATPVTLNLNGHTITNLVENNRLFQVTASSFTVDGTAAGSKMEIPETNTGSFGFIKVEKASKITLNGGTYAGDTDDGAFIKLFHNEDLLDASGSTVYLNDVEMTSNNRFVFTDSLTTAADTPTLVVDGGTYTTEGKAFIIEAKSQSPITFTDVTVTAGTGPVIEVCGLAATFEDCSFTVTDSSNPKHFQATAVAVSDGGTAVIDGGSYCSTGYGVYAYNSGGTITVLDGIVQGGVAAAQADALPGGAESTIYLKGGEFTGPITSNGEEQSKIEVTGGTYNYDISTYVPEGTGLVENENGTFTVGAVVAKIGDTPYTSLAQALAEAKDGDTIRLTAASTVSDALTFPADTALTLDLNGQTLTMETQNNNAVYGSLTITDSGTTGSITGNYRFAISKASGAASAGTLTVAGGTLTSSNSYGPIYLTNAEGAFYMTGGTVAGTGGRGAVHVNASGRVEITGGHVDGGAGAGVRLSSSVKNATVIIGAKPAGSEQTLEEAQKVYLSSIAPYGADVTLNSGIIGEVKYGAFGENSTFGCWFANPVSDSRLPAGLQNTAYTVGETTYYKLTALTEQDAAAKITSADGSEKLYYSLAGAADAVGNGDTLTLLADYSGGTIELEVYDVTVDLYGHTLTGTGTDPALYIHPLYGTACPDEREIRLVSSRPDGTITGAPALQVTLGNSQNVTPIIIEDAVNLVSSEAGEFPLEMGSGAYLNNSTKNAAYVNGGFRPAEDESYIYGAYGDALDLSPSKTVILTNDLTRSSAVLVTESSTLDLNGKTIYQTGTGTSAAAFKLDGDNVSFTLKNGSVESDGDGIWLGIAENSDALTVDGVDITCSGYGVVTNGTTFGHTIVIRDSSIVNTVTDDGAAIFLPSWDSTLTVTGSEITGPTGIEIRAGTLNVEENSRITGTGAYQMTPNGSGTTTVGAGIAVMQHTTGKALQVNISGGTVTGERSIAEANPQGNPEETIGQVSISITGGSFIGQVESADVTGFITGGRFSSDVKEYVGHNHDELATGDGTATPYLVGRYTDTGAAAEMAARTAKVTYTWTSGEVVDVYYASLGGALQEAGDALDAGNSAVITLQASSDEQLTIGRPMTIMKNGYAASGLKASSGYQIIENDESYRVIAAPTVAEGSYTIQFLFEKLDGTGYEQNAAYPAITDADQAAVEAAIAQGIPGFTLETFAESDSTYTLTYLRNTYSVAFSSEGEAIQSQTVKYGAEVTAPAAPVRNDYTFQGWKAGSVVLQPEEKITVSGAVEFAAQWSFNGSASSSHSSHSGGSSGGSYRDREYDFWMEVQEKLLEAGSGDTVQANAKGYDRMPWTVMAALRDAEGVTLHITWNGGEDIIIPSQAALSEQNRVYYPLSYLEKMEFETAPEAQAPTGSSGAANPETGGILMVTAPEAADFITTPAGEPEVTDPQRGLAANSELAAQGIEQAIPGIYEPEQTVSGSDAEQSGFGGILIAGAVLLLAAAGGGFWYWKCRSAD